MSVVSLSKHSMSAGVVCPSSATVTGEFLKEYASFVAV